MKMTKPKAINRKKLVAFALLVSNNSLHTVAHPGVDCQENLTRFFVES